MDICARNSYVCGSHRRHEWRHARHLALSVMVVLDALLKRSQVLRPPSNQRTMFNGRIIRARGVTWLSLPAKHTALWAASQDRPRKNN